MKLSEKLSKTALQADDLLTSLDASVDAVEKLEAQNEKLQRELNTANARIIELLNIVAKGIKNEPQDLKYIKGIAKQRCESLQISENAVWHYFAKACLDCILPTPEFLPEPNEH